MKLKLIANKTPIERAHCIEEELKLPFELYIKRDDETGFLTSGNKIRKLEYLLFEAKKQAADTVFTCGGIQSNHARATAVAARRIGINSRLFLRGTPEKSVNGNLLINKLIGSELEFVTSEEYREIDSIFEVRKTEMEKSGKKVYIIPEGGSNSLGSLGYMDGLKELYSQLDLTAVSAIFCALGSGGTYAGLLAGVKMLGLKTRVIGINVTKQPADFYKDKVLNIIDGLKQYGYCPKVSAEDIEIIDDFSGPAYAIPTNEDIELIKKIAKISGILLDPVYTGKAFRGMIEIAGNKFKGNKVVFIHTGGTFELFDRPDLF